MQSVSTFPGGSTITEHPDLAELCRRERVVTCYLDTEVTTEDAGHRAGIRWKDISRRLEGSGVGARTLEAMGAAVEDLRRLGPSLCVMASGPDVLLAEVGQGALGRDFGCAGPLPVLGPLLEWRQHDVAYMTVACDRAGADIAALGPGAAFTASSGDDDRHDPDLHKVPSGGWSQRRYQQRVENAWDRNARETVDLVERLAKQVQPRLVLYGGDPHACALVEEHAGAALRPLLQRVPLSRAADGSQAHDMHEVHRAVETAVAADTARILATSREMSAKGLGAMGPRRVLEAITASQAQMLLVHEDGPDERRAYMSRDPLGLALDRSTVEAFGGEVSEVPLADAAILGALTSGASVRMVPRSAVPEGMAALLRFP